MGGRSFNITSGAFGDTLLHCKRGTFVALVNLCLQHLFRIQFHKALLNGAVSKLLVELPRTLKGQNGIEFDFQSISQHYSSLSRKNSCLLGLFSSF